MITVTERDRFVKSLFLFVVVLLAGCAASVKQGYVGAAKPDSEIAIVESVGDVGFRIDRTIHNLKATAYVMSVNGFQVGTEAYGFPITTKVLPGKADMWLYCVLPYGSADPRSPVERRGVGLYGTISTYAKHQLTVDLAAGKRYELRCEPAPGYRARFWLEEAAK
jgi:hypothetical protein